MEGANPIQQQKKIKTGSVSVQSLLNWFVFFLAFPAINILGNSITFYLFILLVLKYKNFFTGKYPGKLAYGLFFVTVITATLAAPYAEMPRHPGFMHAFQFVVQYTYWILIAIFFTVFGKKIDLFDLCKWAFYGIICATIGFYIIPFEISSPVLSLTSTISRNSFVFNLICVVPLSFYYIHKRYLPYQQTLWLMFFFFDFLLTNGRSGAIIGILEILLIAMVIFPVFAKTLRWILVPMILIFGALQNNDVQLYLNATANSVESFSPRLASLMRNEGEGDLKEDKSWLHRKLMIDKGFEIIDEFPFLGVGPSNFKYFDSRLDAFLQYDRLSNLSKEYYNHRSAHNTYIQVLSELGMIGFAAIILLFAPIIISAGKQIITQQIYTNLLFMFPVVGICMHFYAISALTGAIPWFVTGLAYFAQHKKSMS